MFMSKLPWIKVLSLVFNIGKQHMHISNVNKMETEECQPLPFLTSENVQPAFIMTAKMPCQQKSLLWFMKFHKEWNRFSICYMIRVGELQQAIMQDKCSYPFLLKLDTNQNRILETEILAEYKWQVSFILLWRKTFN